MAAAAIVLGARQAIAPAKSSPESIEEALRLLESDPSVWEPRTRAAVRAAAVLVERGEVRTAEGYYVLALQYMREHNASGAEALFKRAIAARPDWSWPYVGLGNLLGGYMLGRTQGAIAALRKAAELDPDWSRPYDSLAIILRLEGRLDEAEEAAMKALELDPYNVATNTNYANLLVAMDRLDEAERFYLIARNLDPAHPKPYYNLACLYSLQGAVDAAIENLEEAIKRAGSLRVEARTDPDFDPIRQKPRFRRLVYLEEFRHDLLDEAEAAPDLDADAAPMPAPEER